MRRIHDVPEKGTLQFLLNAFLGAYNRRTDVLARGASGGDTQKLDAILKNQTTIIDMLSPLGSVPNTLGLMETRSETTHGIVFELQQFNGKVDEFMATQEERLRAVKGKLDAIQSGVDKIQQQLADLKANNPELDDEISAIEETAAAIDTDVNPAAVPPTPTEPPV